MKLEQRNAVKAISCGVVASLFLSSTFIINSVLAGAGGYWAWTATLRSLFLIPILAIVTLLSRKIFPLIKAIKQEPLLFVKWGIVGFGLLYTSLAVASILSPGWMVAAAFQINILAGILLAPFIYSDERKAIPKRPLILSGIIIIGVFVMQFEKMSQLNSFGATMFSLLIVLVGAIVWPLGNRKLLVDLESKGLHLNALQRVLGMTIGSLPLLLVLAIVGYSQSGWPTVAQCQSSVYSALLSGFLGGVGFYQATQIVKKNPVALAAIEATQVFEIAFTLIGEMILKGTPMPGIYGKTGFIIIFLGITIHFINTFKHSKKFQVELAG